MPRVALISSCIIPAVHMATHDPKVRLAQTHSALVELERHGMFSKVFVVDNSGCDISILHEMHHWSAGWLNTYSYKTDTGNVARYGYGYGEADIYQYASTVLPYDIGSVYKISGRYVVKNIQTIMPRMDTYRAFFYTYYPKILEYRHYVHTAFFKIQVRDLGHVAAFAKAEVANKAMLPLEAALYRWSEQSGEDRHWIRLPQPQYVGTSGLTGRSLSRASFPYNILRYCGSQVKMAFGLSRI